MNIETQVIDGYNKYKPRVHSGDRLDKLRGILNEIADIEHDGMLREHAKDRECNRLIAEIGANGGQFLIGTEEDEGFIMVVDVAAGHGPRCTVSVCWCEPLARVECDAGDEWGAQ